MTSPFPSIQFTGPAEHLMWVRRTKEAVDIPVIGSLNAVVHETWLEYAKLMEQTGVDALECNFFASPKSFSKTGAEIEDEQVSLVAELKAAVSIPVTVKLSSFYANPLNVIARMDKAGADGVVLFNRLFEPDLDPDKGTHKFPLNLSDDKSYRLPLRYAGLLEGNIDASVCCSSGIFSGKTVIKTILAGADAVQVVSSIYKNGLDHISTLLQEVDAWLDKHEETSLSACKGKLSKRNSTDPWAYTRAQYVKLLLNPKKLMGNS
jgi:dihydroorotate dehydrogenase (fumarate)